MEYLYVCLSAFCSLIALFVLTKIVGNKQVSELTMFDYIISISIGSIAAEMATELEKPIKPFIAMVIYALSAFLVSLATERSLVLRRLFFGRSKILMKNGQIYRENFKQSHIDLSEFLMQCRSMGYFDLTDIDTAVLEPNGKISILPFPDCRPVTARDLKAVPEPDSLCINVIMDGVVLHKNLTEAGRNEDWLKSEIRARGIKHIEDIFLATLDRSGTLAIFADSKKRDKNDIFE